MEDKWQQFRKMVVEFDKVGERKYKKMYIQKGEQGGKKKEKKRKHTFPDYISSCTCIPKILITETDQGIKSLVLVIVLEVCSVFFLHFSPLLGVAGKLDIDQLSNVGEKKNVNRRRRKLRLKREAQIKTFFFLSELS